MKESKKNIKRFPVIIIFILAISLLLILSSCTQSISLYFAEYTETDSYLVKEIREVKVDGSIYKKVVEELLKGPESSDLYPTIPSDVRVNSVEISGGTAIVDFSREIITNLDEIPHSSATETMAVYSVVNALTEFEEINSVKITVEGKDSGQIDGLYIEDFWGHIGIYEEFTRNEEIIKDR